MDIGKIIKELRIEKRLSREELAKNIGYSASIIRYWENNVKTPNALAIIALTNFFNVTSDYVLGLEDKFGNKIKQNALLEKESYKMRIFATRLNELILENNLNRTKLANKLNYNKQTVINWCEDQNEPKVTQIKELCTFFQVTADYLIGLEDEFGNKIDQNDAPKVEEKKETELIEVPIAARSRGNKIPPKTYLMTEEQLDELVNRIRGTKD